MCISIPFEDKHIKWAEQVNAESNYRELRRTTHTGERIQQPDSVYRFLDDVEIPILPSDVSEQNGNAFECGIELLKHQYSLFKIRLRTFNSDNQILDGVVLKVVHELRIQLLIGSILSEFLF